MTNSRRIATLKARAAKLYTHVIARSDLSCGARLTDTIRPDVRRAEDEFNAIMDELKRIDPTCPGYTGGASS